MCVLCALTFCLQAQFMKLDASFYSEALDEIKKVDIYLPTDYYENLEQEYAVIYYLHGALGDQNSGNGKAMRYYLLHNQDTTIQSPPAIFVCPDGSCEPYGGSGYMNSELYGNYDDYITQDLINFVESNFRAYPHRDFRFVCGTSMGGFGSGWHATDKPELFRAAFPFIGFLSMSNEFLYIWREMVYEENNSYTDISSSAGTNTLLLLTMCGSVCPNMSMPNYVELPWDSAGALIDSVVAKWKNTAASKVQDIPEDLNLPFFLGCGTEDYMGTYPLYLQFEDSLTHYGIPYQTNYFEGGHEDDFVTWQKGFHWMDSIINYSFQTMGVEIVPFKNSSVSIYPNPAHDQLNLIFNNIKCSDITISIYNGTGQLIRKEQQSDIQDAKLSVESLKAGIYFLLLETEEDSFTKKFIKN